MHHDSTRLQNSLIYDYFLRHSATIQSLTKPKIEHIFIVSFYSLNFLRTGLYDRSNGYIFIRVTDGFWWSTTAGSDVYGRALGTGPAHVPPQYNDYRGIGIAVRCVVREG